MSEKKPINASTMARLAGNIESPMTDALVGSSPALDRLRELIAKWRVSSTRTIGGEDGPIAHTLRACADDIENLVRELVPVPPQPQPGVLSVDVTLGSLHHHHAEMPQGGANWRFIALTRAIAAIFDAESAAQFVGVAAPATSAPQLEKEQS